MSPRPADPAVREALLAAATRVLAAEGPQALSSRRLASEAGTSTMAVYTRFGSMDELRREIRRDGFARLDAEIDALPVTPDPVADLAATIDTYFTAGLANPELYRALMIDRPPAGDDDAGTGVFDRLVGAVRRCIDAGRFDSVEPSLLAGWAAEILVTGHGMVTLAVTEVVPVEQVRFLLSDMTYRLAVGFGDDPARADRSIQSATQEKQHDHHTTTSAAACRQAAAPAAACRDALDARDVGVQRCV